MEFCREPALMLDIYRNYDCDVQCTNLFETVCKALALAGSSVRIDFEIPLNFESGSDESRVRSIA